MDMNSILAQVDAMETMLDDLYTNMMPLVSQFTNLGRAIGGVGALIYISAKVWGHIARAEPIDVYPLLRPFLIGLCILFFPALCQGLRGFTGALSHSTDSIRNDQSAKIVALQEEKKNILANKPENKDFATDEAYERKLADLAGPTGMGGIGDRMSLTFQKVSYDVNQNFREWMKNTLELFHVGARLLIHFLSTFILVVLSVLGPITFGIAIFPGFGGGIQKWLGHFITISLWVPVANVFGAMMASFQVQMLQGDIDRLNAQRGVDSADFGYLVFLLVAIAGYVLVPFITDMLISASGAGSAAGAFVSAATGGAAAAGAGMGAAGRMGAQGVSAGASGVGTVVGAAQGGFGFSGAANMTRGEQLGHRAGSAIRERVGGYFGRNNGNS
ncbi:hypothetical protein [Hymenobacter mucosus]|nr:hypothetical protein [Hymenobacter mucosus]MDF7815521.1 hypothetical protein [Hymenobacter sp. YC55]